MNKDIIVLVRGAGDIATGIIWYLFKAGFKVICTEIKKPTTIRRSVSFSNAIYNNQMVVDGVICRLVKDSEDIQTFFDNNIVPIIVDENLDFLNIIKPDVLVDSIIAKKNIGTNIKMANLVIGIGPGFTPNKDCHFAVETMRGHKLGTIYKNESPIENTGIPGDIVGFAKERVIHSKYDGIINNIKQIGDIVKKDDIIAIINSQNNKYEVKASIDGVLRGIIQNGFCVYKGLKIADIDPRIEEKNNCFSISDKSKTIAGAVLLIINNYCSYK